MPCWLRRLMLFFVALIVNGTLPPASLCAAVEPASANTLAITEILYYPAIPTAAETAEGYGDQDEFEFLEIQNVSTNEVGLAGVRFTLGIQFQFEGILGPGEFLLVVENEEAFEFRYGSGLPVAGEYSGKLANEGEELLLLGASGEVLHRIRYQRTTPWPSLVSGNSGGASIELLTPELGLDATRGEHWRASFDRLGTPGRGRDEDGDAMADDWERHFLGSTDALPEDDADMDGLTTLREHDLHTDPTDVDSDGDGLPDGVETGTGVYVNSTNTGTNPADWDSDHDGLPDGVETNTAIYVGDTDTGTHPLLSDTDMDGFSDKLELDVGTSPLDPASFPQAPGILVFEATPTELTAGEQVTLAWEVQHADAVVIEPGIGAHTNETGQVSFSPIIWDTLIAKESFWTYQDDGSDQGTPWTALGFDDSTWRAGRGQFGYSDNDENTVLDYSTASGSNRVTAYFRRAFVVDDPVRIESLSLHLLRDDGAVVYLNGLEVLRDNMPEGPVQHHTLATAAIGGADENRYRTFALPSTGLLRGNNVLAVELHQVSATGDADASFDLGLEAATRVGTATYTLTASNAYRLASASVAVTVYPDEPPIIHEFKASAVHIVRGDAVVLSWNLEGIVDRVEIEPGVGEVAGNEVTVVPAAQETVVPTESVWKYWDQGAPEATWMEAEFDDDAWPAGPAPLGIGNEYHATVLYYCCGETVYFRRSFLVSDRAGVAAANLRMRRDDGAHVFLNGGELIRDNLAEGDVHHYTLAASHAQDDGEAFHNYPINPALLREGTNVLAIGVHQASLTSADVQFDMGLFVERRDSRSATYRLSVSNGAGTSRAEVTIDRYSNSEELLSYHDTWRFDQSGVTPPPEWKESGFDDTHWDVGPGVLGVEDTGVAVPLLRTPLRLPTETYTPTVYLRTRFMMPPDLSGLHAPELTHLLDDGAVVYLNGREIHRLGAEPGNEFASRVVGDTTFEGPFQVPVTALVPGENVMAVELHQPYISTTDIVWGCKLVAFMDAAVPFRLLSAVMDTNRTRIVASFSHPLDPPTALGPALYSVINDRGGELEVLSVELVNRTNLVFTTSERADGASYWLRVSGLTSEHGIALSLDRVGVAYQVVLLPIDAEWTYEESGMTPPADWREIHFDDSSWLSGAALLGRNSLFPPPEPIRTLLTIPIIPGFERRYFRARFGVPPEWPRVGLNARHIVDDGVVLYLNGSEVHRFGIAPDGTPIGFVPTAAYQGPFELAPNVLTSGTNVLSAVVTTAGDSDLVFGAELKLELAPTDAALEIRRTAGEVALLWNGEEFVVEQTERIGDPWISLPLADSPHRLSVANADAVFFRLRRR